MKFDQRLLWTEDDDEGLEEILALARVISKICEVTIKNLDMEKELIPPALLFCAVSELLGYADVDSQDLMKDEELKRQMKVILDAAFRVMRGQPLALN
mgnify:CR=1 FL=1|jgi:hypothetical protein|tara:strand:- start:2726 stop:3019 length:294 start_codon:yes stop_codon:yes gene_type:complete